MASFLENCAGFEWDEGNSMKNWYGHRVSDLECEEIFANKPLIIAVNTKHLSKEKRYEALGKTNQSRWLFATFTIRRNLIRIISAREMNRKESNRYEKEIKGSS